MFRGALLATIVGMVVSTGANALSDQRELITEARKVGKSTSEYAESNKSSKRMFMEREEGRTWVTMKSGDEHLDSSGSWSENTVAKVDVWIKEGRICHVSMERSSASGDWFMWSDYSYRPDGSLARLVSGYFAYAPEDGAVMREQLYSPEGHLLHHGATYTSIDGKLKFSGAKAGRLREVEPPSRLIVRTKDWGFIPLIAMR